jgi:hypothetical protein
MPAPWPNSRQFPPLTWTPSSIVGSVDHVTSARRSAFLITAISLLLFCSRQVHGQTLPNEPSVHAPTTQADDDTLLILELGAATNWNFTGGAATFAPNLAAECTPIENWLELEAGVSPFFTRNSTEWDTDFLFKKPWDLTPKAEFMFGVGPQWTYVRMAGKTSNLFAAEVAGDFMFWPTGNHRFGWYLEPAYDYSFAGGHPQSIGMSAGLLIGIR